jgi:hypothetical protein
MNRDYVKAHDIVDRYLKGDLSAEDVTAFEEHCLWCRESLDELELAERMRQGFKDVGRSANERAWSSRLKFMLSSPQYGAAASALLLASLLTTGVLYRQLDDESTTTFASAEVYTLEVHRGAGDDISQRITVPAPDAHVVLVVYPDDIAAERYRVTLYRSGDVAPRWQEQVDKPTAEALAITLPGSLLGPGEYQLRVDDAAAAPGARVVTDVRFATVPENQVR